MKSKEQTGLWVLIHCEWAGRNPQMARVDEMTYAVYSTRKRAERHLLGKVYVSAYSWWKLERHPLDPKVTDFINFDTQTFFYNHLGKLVCQMGKEGWVIKLQKVQQRALAEFPGR